MSVQDWALIITALGGAVGLGGGIRAVATTIRLVRRGVSAREGKRKIDIVQQRDEALADLADERDRTNAAVVSAEKSAARADAEMTRADWAEENRQRAVENEQRSKEHAADLRVRLVDRGVPREQLPAWPHMEDPIPRAVLNLRILEGQRVKHPTVDDEPEFYKTTTRDAIESDRWRPDSPDQDDPDRRRPRH